MNKVRGAVSELGVTNAHQEGHRGISNISAFLEGMLALR